MPEGYYPVPNTATPDLSDPATAGILLSWLAGRATIDISQTSGHWAVLLVIRGEEWHHAPTLGEAVAAALIALGGEVGR